MDIFLLNAAPGSPKGRNVLTRTILPDHFAIPAKKMIILELLK